MLVSKKRLKREVSRQADIANDLLKENRRLEIELIELKNQYNNLSFWVGDGMDHLTQSCSLKEKGEHFELPERHEALNILARFLRWSRPVGGDCELYSHEQLAFWDGNKKRVFELIGFTFEMKHIPRILSELCGEGWRESLSDNKNRILDTK